MRSLPSVFEHRPFEGPHIRALLCARGHKKLMVTFDSWAQDKAGWAKASPSRAFDESGFDQLRIQTSRNDWFVNADTPSFEAEINGLALQYSRVHALGYSMGGYGAFRFSDALRVDQLVAVSPQFSIDPGVVPFETRYPAEALGFDPILGAMPASRRRAMRAQVLVDSLNRIDLAHSRLIADSFHEVRIVRLGFAGHPATAVLQEGGRGYCAHRSAMSVGLEEALIRSAHRACRRVSPSYWQRMARQARRSSRLELMRFAQGQAAALA